MKQSQLFTKTRKDIDSSETSKNAQLLIRAGYVKKELAGVYTFLPLGLRTLEKINDIIRDEMNAAGGQEIRMTSLQGKDIWESTNRWSDEVVDNWFKTTLKNGSELGLAFTHEEPLTQLMTQFISSYKDLPSYAYQIQTKFRNELRAKAGLMRGREFLMKDLYSFSSSTEEHEAFYETMKDVYMNVFNRLGFGDSTYVTISNGGSFSKYSYEFQTVCEAGEDIIYIDDEKKLAVNKDDFNEETLKDFEFETDVEKLRTEKSVEVGDIYSLGTKYSESLGLNFTDESGASRPVVMGSYGMSPTRLMGVIVELNSDEAGIQWPMAVAPFQVHLLNLNKDSVQADSIYVALQEAGIEVLYDDRSVGAGQKFTDSDLIGIPFRAVIGSKTGDKIELKARVAEEAKLVDITEVIATVTNSNS